MYLTSIKFKYLLKLKIINAAADYSLKTKLLKSRLSFQIISLGLASPFDIDLFERIY
jgi:hypothetical protein